VGISRLGAASLAIGNGTAGDFSGTLSVTKLQANTNVALVEAAPLAIQVNSSGIGFLIQNTSTDYTDFVSGGVVKGLRGTGTTPMVVGVNAASLTLYSSSTIYFNNVSSVGGNEAVLQAAMYGFAAASQSAAAANDTGISRLNAGIIGVGTGAAASTAGTLVATTLQLASTSGPTWTSGSAAPSSTPAYGSMYSRTAGGVGLTNLYVYTVAGWVGIV